MQQQDLDQVIIIIKNIHETKKKIPYFKDLQEHNVYGQFFTHLDSEDILAIQDLIKQYMNDVIQGLKTKGGEMFRRCYAINKDNFWLFRDLNGDEANVDTDDFQQLGKLFEEQFYKFEGILTKNMMKKPQGLEKTIGAYYDIVYSFFPLYGQIK